MARTKNSFSFAEVTLAELNSKFKEDAKILVSVRFLRANGLMKEATPCRSTYDNVQAAGEAPSIQEISIKEITD